MRKIYKNDRIFKILVIVMCLMRLQGVCSECSDSQWMCDDFSCIPEQQQCDGTVNCPDGSDETAENCIHLYDECVRYAFRCSYGACIASTLSCDGKRDCADNSDELTCCKDEATCAKENLEKWRGQCGMEEMQCVKSKECISVEQVCDGQRDCTDSSDETVEVCGGYSCAKIGFHCGYGGCVDGRAKCNGTKECADGSDEAWELCGTPRKILKGAGGVTTTPIPMPPTRRRPVGTPKPATTTSTTTEAPTPTPDTPPLETGCQIPENLEDLRFRLHPHNTTLLPGSWLVDGEALHVECGQRSGTQSATDLLCDAGKFSGEFPQCRRYCNATMLSGLSTQYECFSSNNRKIAPHLCLDRVLPGTKIRISCASGYKTRGDRERQTIRCLPNGQWSETREPCIQDCGYLSSSFAVLTSGGSSVNQSSVPWHVAIYENINGQFSYICAGSIISPSIVVTAAHCFWDYLNNGQKETHLFKVSAGKYNKAYSQSGDEVPQYSNPTGIYASEFFRGRQNRHKADMALMTLETPFIYNENISAICWPKTGKAIQYVKSGLSGTVTGYGPRSQLEKVDMITRDFYTCKDTPDGRELTDDKFCLYNDHGASVCRGDSGGGFVQIIDELYNLLGIISYTPKAENNCARDGVVGVTNVRYMEDDLKIIFDKEIANDAKKF